MDKLNIIIPQYISSFCIDNCKYCGFKASNTLMIRNRLNLETFKKEFELIVSWGYHVIELVFATDIYFDSERISRYIEYAKDYGNKKNLDLKIGLNSEPFSYDGYKMLHNAGLDFFVVWMETYNKRKYKFYHEGSKRKDNYNFRYESYERAISAGVRNYGMGVLLGLHNWREDVQSLITHGKLLEERFDIAPYIIGLPRFKPAHSVNLNEGIIKVSNEEFLEVCKMYKSAFPNSMLFFNTRENFELNTKACSTNDLFTIDCGTYPGAYLDNSMIKRGFQQFQTYFYERNKTIQKLKDKGYHLNFTW